jgi:hypothetical protein
VRSLRHRVARVALALPPNEQPTLVLRKCGVLGMEVRRARGLRAYSARRCAPLRSHPAQAVSYVLSSGTCAVGPDELKAKLSRVAGNASLPLSGDLGAADSPSQPLARFVRFCCEGDVMSTLQT